MSASMLRQFWSLVEEIHSTTVLKLNDTELIQQLVRQLEDKLPLSLEESNLMTNYISSRTLLIRELVES